VCEKYQIIFHTSLNILKYLLGQTSMILGDLAVVFDSMVLIRCIEHELLPS